MGNNLLLQHILTWSLADLAESYDLQVQLEDDLEQLIKLIIADVKGGATNDDSNK